MKEGLSQGKKHCVLFMGPEELLSLLLAFPFILSDVE